MQFIFYKKSFIKYGDTNLIIKHDTSNSQGGRNFRARLLIMCVAEKQPLM